MADGLVLRAEPRTLLGKKVKQLRRAGRVPGVVYGPVVPETVSVTVERKEFQRFFMANGHSTLFTLEWDGGRQPVFIREVQVDPVKFTPLHIDFFAPNLRKELTATVPVVLHHPNPGAAGVLTTARTEIEVSGLPAAMPHQIDGDISGLVEVGDSLRVGDLTLPAGVTAVTDADELLAHLVAETVETVEEAESLVAEGEPAEAQAAEGQDNPAGVPETEGVTTSGTAVDA